MNGLKGRLNHVWRPLRCAGRKRATPALKFFSTTVIELDAIILELQTEVRHDHCNRIASLGRTAKKLNDRFGSTWHREYPKKDYGNPDFVPVEAIYQDGRDLAASLMDLMNLARRLNDFIGKKSPPQTSSSKLYSPKESKMEEQHVGDKKVKAEALVPFVTLGIVTALPKEFAAVEVMLNEPIEYTFQGSGAGRRYSIGFLEDANQNRHYIAVAMLPIMGNNMSSIITTKLLTYFPNVKNVIMCGIAGGVPNYKEAKEHVRLGDIVVSNKGGVIQYDNVKATVDVTEIRSNASSPSPEMIEAYGYLEKERIKKNYPWEKYLHFADQLEEASRPGEDIDAEGKQIIPSHPTDGTRREGLPKVFSSKIASANTLLKNNVFRDKIGQQFGVKAFEMEASGVADATWIDGQCGYFVVRGICDYCDPAKGDVWQGYAAVTAAAYTRALIESIHANP